MANLVEGSLPRWTAEKKAIARLERDGSQCSQPMATILTSQRGREGESGLIFSDDR